MLRSLAPFFSSGGKMDSSTTFSVRPAVVSRTFVAVAFLSAITMCDAATAAEFCASSDGTLLSALVDAHLIGGSNTIKLVQRTYLLAGEVFQNTGTSSLSIEGGYAAGCVTRTVNAANTTIDFGGSGVRFQLSGGSSFLGFDGLTLSHGNGLLLLAGTYHDLVANDSGSVSLSNVRVTGFSGNAADAQDPYHQPAGIYAVDGTLTLRSVQFDHLSQVGASPCDVVLGPDGDVDGLLDFVTADLSGDKDLCIATGQAKSGNFQFNIYNSIIWASDGLLSEVHGIDLFATNPTLNVSLVDDVFHGYFGYGSPSIVGQLSQDPLWVSPATSDYHLKYQSVPASPAINTATPIDPLGIPATDISGGPRSIGSRPDRGAYESPFDDSTVFVVTKTADTNDGVCDADCSLREAITAANSLPNAATIKFALGAGCGSPNYTPYTIALGSVLPNIDSPVIIDGYTQAGSTVNTDANAFNAHLCVLLKPASGTLTFAFRVPASTTQGSLNLRGIGMGGFGQDIVLLGGADHVIAGNQIGGAVAGVDLPGPGLYGLSVGLSAGGSLVIGGTDPSARNVIGGALSYGIYLQSGVVSTPDQCRILNNLIGATPNGLAKNPNGYGIVLSGSGCSVAENRIVGNQYHGIWIAGGDNNVVQQNVLGVFVNGAYEVSNAGAGVQITAGTNNTIGGSRSASGGAFLGNLVRGMFLSGVQDSAAAGSENSIRGNLIYDNGFTGDAMDIDLGSDGVTPNDVNDADIGPNDKQNFPLVTGLQLGVGSTDVPATLSCRLNSLPGTYKIDAYFSNGCSANGRGHAERYAGSGTVTIGAGSNNQTFAVAIVLPNIQSDAQVSLTATGSSAGTGATSEIGPCFAASHDTIFKDSFD